jgi:hypothetical protein
MRSQRANRKSSVVKPKTTAFPFLAGTLRTHVLDLFENSPAIMRQNPPFYRLVPETHAARALRVVHDCFFFHLISSFNLQDE